jgi:hypothetical protein
MLAGQRQKDGFSDQSEGINLVEYGVGGAKTKR